MKKICFYHCDDFDGRCAAAIVKNFEPEVELIPFNYNNKFNFFKVTKEQTIYFVDISLPVNQMLELNKICDNFIYIDHHISKLENLNLKDFKGIQDSTTAACILTWKYFNKDLNNLPKAVQLIGRYDIFDLDEEVLAFQNGLYIYEEELVNELKKRNELSLWKSLFNNDDNLLQKIKSEGTIIKKFVDFRNKKECNNNANEIKFKGYTALIINSNKFTSTLFKHHKKYKEVDLLIIFCRTKNSWKFSIYTTKDNIDVSTICKSYGGGGHKKAAGFFCNTIPDDFKKLNYF